MAIKQRSGVVTLLRVHDLGTGYGPSTDFLNVEVIVWLDSKPGFAYGFQLRRDDYLPAREGMFQLLLAAFRNQWPVVMDTDEESGHKNHHIIRVWVDRSSINTTPETPTEALPIKSVGSSRRIKSRR